MIKYWSLRFGVYHHTLKLLLENVKQAGIAVVALFPLAMPALVLIPFVFIGIILNPETTSTSFFNTLWGYLLLLYTWVNLQKTAILASGYSNYLSLLPVSKPMRVIGDLLVVSYAANFFVLAPIFLFFYAIFNFTGDANELLEATVLVLSLLLLSCYYCFKALRTRTPWLSLVVFPIVISLVVTDLSKASYLVGWLAAIFAEQWFYPKFKLPKKLATSWLYLFLKWDLENPENNKLTIISSLLLLAIAKVVIGSTNAEVANYFLNFTAFVFGIVWAANLFSMQNLKSKFESYLVSLPISSSNIQIKSIEYSVIKLLVFGLVLLVSDIFSVKHFALFFSFYALAVWAIIKWQKRFLLPPIVLGVVLTAISVVVS